MSQDFFSCSEHRREPRHPGKPETFCTVVDSNGQRWPAWLRDISSGGISILLNPLFEPGSLLSIELVNDQTGVWRRLPVQVRHSSICFPNDAWLHGCAFAEKLSPEELHHLVEEMKWP